MGSKVITELSPTELNAQVNQWKTDDNGNKYVDYDADKEAARQYFLQEVNDHSKFHYSLKEKLEFLFANEYYDPSVWTQYGLQIDDEGSIIRDSSYEKIKELYNLVYDKKHRFESYMGALKFYTQYAMKSFDGKVWMERFEDRVVANALLLGRGDIYDARLIAEEIVSGRLQPATPTFSNAGKTQRGEYVSCFLLDQIGDDMESISRAFTNALQLSKRGGGVGLNLSNIREYGAPIKKIEGQSSGVVPVMKILEDSFSYANQLGTRQGAGAIYLNAHHPDIERFLDTKRENADEKIRIKTLSLGIVIPDITFELAKTNEDMYLFSPYDVERVYGVPFSQISVTEKYYEMIDNPDIKKTKINARELFSTIAELQFESGYPYLMFEDTVNAANPIEGRISMSNLCSEILQVSEPSTYKESGEYEHIGRDISCNLASMNIVKSLDGGDLGSTVATAIRALSAVSDLSDIEAVPSIKRGNNSSRAVGLGQMNLHGFLIREGVPYGNEDALNFTNNYFMTVAYYALRESNLLAIETSSPFEGFDRSKYADKGYLIEKYSQEGMINHSEKTLEIFGKYNVPVITLDDWKELAEMIEEFGLYNAYLQAVAPTGSISYVNYSTSSIHPITDKMETRKEGMTGRVYYPQPYVTNENFDQVEDAYDIGYERLIDTYAEATKHVDQGMSLTLFLRGEHNTRDLNRAYIYAWRKGIKTIYYVRVRSNGIEGLGMEECVTCQI